QAPLILVVAPRRAEGEIGPLVLEDETGRERGARALPRRQAGGKPRLEPEHLGPAAEAESQARDHRRAVQPAARGRGRDHVAPAVDDIEMASVAPLDRRL